MNVVIGAEAAQFPEKEYKNGIAIAVYMWISLQTHSYFLWWHWLYNKKGKSIGQVLAWKSGLYSL
jgi:hypothetical protein